MIIIDASSSFTVLIQAASSLKCWFIGQEIAAWTKDSHGGLGDEQVSHCVQGCTVQQAIKTLNRDYGESESIFLTYCIDDGEAARAMGVHPVIAAEHDTAADVAARLVSDTVRLRKGVMYCPVDPSVSKISIAFNALLVKATDYLNEKLDESGTLSVDFQQPLRQLMEKTEAAGKPVIDTLDRIRIVLDRRETRRRLHHMEQATGGLVRWSPAVLVSGHGSEATNEISAMQQALRQCNALICKPCVACGVPQSHDMRLVWDADSLPPTMEVCPYLAESFHNHGGNVIKCYAAGSRVFLRAAPSIPDYPFECIDKNVDSNDQDSGHQTGENFTSAHQRHEIAFHSLKNLPCISADAIKAALAQDQNTIEAAQRCAEVIRDATGLSIFGFDFTIPSAGTGFLLVDVNAFPSFKGVDGAAESLRQLLQQVCQNLESKRTCIL